MGFKDEEFTCKWASEFDLYVIKFSSFREDRKYRFYEGITVWCYGAYSCFLSLLSGDTSSTDSNSLYSILTPA